MPASLPFYNNSFVDSITRQAMMPAAVAEREKATARREAQAKALAAVPAQQAAAQAALAARQSTFLDNLVIPEPYSDPASAAWKNPYYTGPATGYHRFDPDQVGAGLTHSDDGLVSAFDRIIRSVRQNPIDLTGYYGSKKYADVADRLGSGGNLPFGLTLEGIARDAGKEWEPPDPRLTAALKYNEQLKKDQAAYRAFTSDKGYGHAFNELGINIADLADPAKLAALGPDKKAAIFDIQARYNQEKNQRPKSGILDSLPGKIGLGLAGLINPFAAAGLGAFAGGLSGEGGLLGAAKGALSGYGLGSLTHGFTSPGIPSGTDPRFPGSLGGKGTIRPGAGPDLGTISDATGIGFGTTPGGSTFPVFGPGGPGGGGGGVWDFPSPRLPGPRGPAPGSDTPTPWTPPFIPIPPLLPPGESPPGSDTAPPEEDPVIPPIIPIPGTPPTGSGGSPSIPTPTAGPTYALGGGGGQQSFPPFQPGAIPGPPDPLKYFQFGQNPFL
jgi:hypothetical protein